MELKKRLTTLVSNWLGVILAVIIVLVSAIFGGMYLYARSTADNTISFVTQVIYLLEPGLVPTATLENPLAYVYHLVLQVYNQYPYTVDITVSNISVVADTYTFPVSQDGAWNKSAPYGYTTFEGNITIDAKTFDTLVTKGTMDLEIKGTISGSCRYKFVSRYSKHSFNTLSKGVSFSYVTPK